VLALEIILLTILFIAWVVTLALVIMDRMSIGGKIVWLLAVTVLAPIAIPVYLIVRTRRGSDEFEGAGSAG
jgi:hypothetical protein